MSVPVIVAATATIVLTIIRMRHSRLTVMVVVVSLFGIGAPVVARAADSSHIDRDRLRFGFSRSSHISTPPQVIFVERTGANDRGRWTVTVDKPWLEVSPAQGTVPGDFRVALRPSAIPSGVHDRATIVVSGDASSAWRDTVVVDVEVIAGDSGPFGYVDVPSDHTLVTDGDLRIGGWVLDDVGVQAIEACRDVMPRRTSLPSCLDGHGARICTADPYAFARPDVAALFAAVPHNDTAGWTCDIDTAAWPRAQQGTLRVRVVARDLAGHVTTLGERQVTVEPVTASVAATIRWLWMPAAAVLAFLVLHAAALTMARRSSAASPPPVSAAGPVWFDRYGAVLISVAAFFLAVRGGGGLSYDELFTYEHFVRGASVWQSATRVGVFNNHIAYSLLANLSVRLLGPTEFSVRLPAALLTAAAPYCLWRFVREFAPPATALLAAGLLALSPMTHEWSYAARGYAGLALLTIISTRAWFRLLSAVSWRWSAVYVLSTIGCVYFNMYGVWVVAIQYGVWLIETVRGVRPLRAMRRLWWAFLAVVAGVLLLYGPVIAPLLQVAAIRGRTAVVWGFPVDLFRALFGITGAAAYAPVVLLVCAGLIRLRRRPLVLAYSLALLLVPLAAVWLVARPLDLFPRLFHFWSPFAAIILAVAVTGIGETAWSGSRRWLSALALTAVGFVIVTWLRVDVNERPDGGYRSFLLAQAAKTPHAMAIVAAGPDADILSFYLPARPSIITSSGDLDRMTRDHEPFVLVYHHPGWETPEQQRIRDLANRRCRAAESSLVAVYHCGL